MKITGRTLVIPGDDIPADLIYPGMYLTETDRVAQGRHMFEALDPALPEKVAQYPILVTGWNLGPGSAREQTATGLLGAGVKLVIGHSFSRTFYRNALNSGLPLIASPELADALATDDFVTVDLEAGEALVGECRIPFLPLAPDLLGIVAAGGIWGTYGSAKPARAEGEQAKLASGDLPQTLVEKAFSRASGRPVRAGELVTVAPDWVFALDDGIGGAVAYLEKYGIEKIQLADRTSLFFDHYAPANNVHHASLQKLGREFALRHQIRSLHDVGDGISHQVAVEQRLVGPGEIVLSMDSHTMSIGALCSVGLGVGNGEIAYIWANGVTWFQVPRSRRIELLGSLPSGVSAKDVMLSVLGTHTARWGAYYAIEFHGEGLGEFDISARMTLCNLCTELGAKTALVAPDNVTRSYMAEGGTAIELAPWQPDRGASYDDTCSVDLSSLVPMIACPHTVDNVVPVHTIAGQKINQAFLGTCTNGRYEDLFAAAELLRGRRVAPSVRMIVTPASDAILKRALSNGVIATLLDAGCTITTPGCGACAGIHQGVLAQGEVCISSSSRNFIGRMGDREAIIFLSSPATVAASAIEGVITDPRSLMT